MRRTGWLRAGSTRSRWLPWSEGYERAWLAVDLLAALTVWALLVPQALAYAQLAGLDPVVGLYASLGAIIGYALIGGVREMSVGPEATIALLTVSVVGSAERGGDPVRFAALAAGLALVTGVVLILGGLARLGLSAATCRGRC